MRSKKSKEPSNSKMPSAAPRHPYAQKETLGSQRTADSDSHRLDDNRDQDHDVTNGSDPERSGGADRTTPVPVLGGSTLLERKSLAATQRESVVPMMMADASYMALGEQRIRVRRTGKGGDLTDGAYGSCHTPHARASNATHSFKANSYFAIRLLRWMLLIVALDIVALGCFFVMRDRQNREIRRNIANPGMERNVADETNGVLGFALAFGDLQQNYGVVVAVASLAYFLCPGVFLLGLPATGWHWFEPFKREERITPNGRLQKVKRTIFLQLCEIICVIIFFCMGAIVVIMVFYVTNGTLLKMIKEQRAAECAFVLGAGAMFILVRKEIRCFARFREHLKMQLGAFSEADQTGEVRDRIRRRRRKRQQKKSIGEAATGLTTRGGDQVYDVAYARKRLYRGAQLNDLRLLKRTLRIAKQQLGEYFARGMYPDANIFFSFFCMSKKNPMHVAAFHGHIAAMELLYHAHFPVNSFDKISRVRFSTGDMFWYLAHFFIGKTVVSGKDTYGPSSIMKSTVVTPLHCAVSTGRIDAVRWLIEHGADVNICSKSTQRSARLPALFLADHPEIARLLLAAGANPLVVPDPGHMNTITALQLAYLRGNYAVAQELEKWGGDVALTPLHTAAAMNDTARIRHFLRRSVPADCLGELGYVALNRRTPLHWATINGALNAVELLIGAHADVNFRDSGGRTPLHWAARVKRLEIVRVLLEHGADPNLLDEGGMSPILCAACAGSTPADLFHELVRAGGDINHQMASTGDTPLHIAVKLDDEPTALALLSNGGDILRTNKDGLRPIDCTTSTHLQFALKRAAGNRDVMISYTHSHMEFALKLRRSLEGANITTWLDLMEPSGIGGGAVWREEIARGVTNAAVVICILTEDYKQSPWCLKELALAKQVGTPILAISTEHAEVSGELQVFLYTRQIVPFEDAIKSMTQVSSKEVRYAYDEDMYKQQLRLLVDGLRDEIEKHKAENLRKNLRAGNAPQTMPLSGNLANAASGGADPNSLGLSRSPFNEQKAITAQREEQFLATVRGEQRAQDGGRGHDGNRWNGTALQTLRETDVSNSMCSDDSASVSNSVVMSQSGYYVYRPIEEQTQRSRRAYRPSVLETVAEVHQTTAKGEQFVFISHGDAHVRFVKRLCAALCREGELHCFVDGKRQNRTALRKMESTDSNPPSSNESDSIADENMLVRFQEAKEAILRCTAFILILSEKTIESQMVKDQLAFAETNSKRILPVVVNKMQFSLDMQYSLSRSDFYYFFALNDMPGFDRSLQQMLSALRDQQAHESVSSDPSPSMAAARSAYDNGSFYSSSDVMPPSFSSSRLRAGSIGATPMNAVIDWIELPPSTRVNRSFVGSTPLGSSRSVTSDFNFQQSMLGNLSFMSRISDEMEAEIDDDDLSDLDDHDDDEDVVAAWREHHRPSDRHPRDHDQDRDRLRDHDHNQGNLYEQPPMLPVTVRALASNDSIISNRSMLSNVSVSMLESTPEDDECASIDAVRRQAVDV